MSGFTRRDAPWPDALIGLLYIGWIAGAVWTASVPHVARDEHSETAGSVHALETPLVLPAVAIREPDPDPEVRVAAGRLVEARVADTRSRILLARRRLSLRPPDFRSTLGLQLKRSFEDEAEFLAARVVRSLEGAP